MERVSTSLADRPVIIGSGLAGLMTALSLAPQPALVVTKAALGDAAASPWAQGGIAAALGPDDDPAQHAADTLAAGDGLCDTDAAARITAAAASAIATLEWHGVAFDRGADGRIALGLEAAHGRRRILHAGGDGSGREIMRRIIEAVQRTPSVAVLERVEARRLVLADGAIAGVLAASPAGPVLLPTSRVVIATGGIGGLYRETSNPLGAIGHGLALAALAGAALADMEFVQFHPTALDAASDPMPLISEAVRGEGAVLVDETGARVMRGHARADLEPRDIVARAVWRHLGQGHRVFLDARAALGPRFRTRFPTIDAACRAAGIDPAAAPIPIRPAAHYHMGGIAVDAEGRSGVEGLWACGEAAATGLHGANRLASNSLLEAAVCSSWVAASIAGTSAKRARPIWSGAVPPAPQPGAVRRIMSHHVGVLRHAEGLLEAIAALRPLAFGMGAEADPALAGLFVATAALLREESRGSHCRVDFPEHAPGWAHGSRYRLRDIERVVNHLLAEPFAHAVGA
jgi:L-aspartate oxidase